MGWTYYSVAFLVALGVPSGWRRNWSFNIIIDLNMLGSKDLGSNVFRTLMCNVGKPWSKQVLVLF